MCTKAPNSCRQDVGQHARLVASARRAREELSTSSQAWAEIPCCNTVGGWTKVAVRQAEFQEACEHLCARAWAALAELGLQCKLSWLRCVLPYNASVVLGHSQGPSPMVQCVPNATCFPCRLLSSSCMQSLASLVGCLPQELGIGVVDEAAVLPAATKNPGISRPSISGRGAPKPVFHAQVPVEGTCGRDVESAS